MQRLIFATTVLQKSFCSLLYLFEFKLAKLEQYLVFMRLDFALVTVCSFHAQIELSFLLQVPSFRVHLLTPHLKQKCLDYYYFLVKGWVRELQMMQHLIGTI